MLKKDTKVINKKYTIIFSHINRLDLLIALFGAFLAISTISFISFNYNSSFLIASFGASAVILYTTPEGVFARGRNLIGGHMIAATIGVIIYSLFGITWWGISLGVTLTILFMVLTDTIHPPAGATVIVAILGKSSFLFILIPVFTGVIVLFLWSILMKRLKSIIKNKNL